MNLFVQNGIESSVSIHTAKYHTILDEVGVFTMEPVDSQCVFVAEPLVSSLSLSNSNIVRAQWSTKLLGRKRMCRWCNS
jgi:hypothetical protein